MWKKLVNLRHRKSRNDRSTTTSSNEGPGSPQLDKEAEQEKPQKNDFIDEEVEVGESMEDADVKLIEMKNRLMVAGVNKLSIENEKRLQRCNEIISLDAEVQELLALIKRARCYNVALDDEVLRKKCELNFLWSQVEGGKEMDVRKREPVLYKKYSNIKTSSNASDVLDLITRRQEALESLRAMTYGKYVSLKHHLESDSVQQSIQRDIIDFGWIVESLNERPPTAPARPPPVKRKLVSTTTGNRSNNDAASDVNVVTIAVKSDTALSLDGCVEDGDFEKGSESTVASSTPPTSPPRPIFPFPERPLPFVNELLQFGPTSNV